MRSDASIFRTALRRLRYWLAGHPLLVTTGPLVTVVLLLLGVPAGFLLVQSLKSTAQSPPEETVSDLQQQTQTRDVSEQKADIKRGPAWTFDGYEAVVQNDEVRRAIKPTFVYTIWTVVLQAIIGTCAALLVHHTKRGGRWLCVALFLPYCGPTLVSVVEWFFLLRKNGPLAVFLYRVLGLPADCWFSKYAFGTLVLVSTWQFYPFVFVAVLASLRRIPLDYYRTAAMDGASPMSQMRFITLPCIRQTVLAVAFLRFLFMFTKFDTPWYIAGSTSLTDVRTLPIIIYRLCTTSGPEFYQEACSLSVLCGACIGLPLLVVYIFWMRARRRRAV
jgi:multiple sugar transport system permease protein